MMVERPGQATTVEETSYYYANGKRIAMNRGGTLAYIFSDHLGGTRVTLNTSTGVTSTVGYFPFGSTRSGSVPTDYRFTGQKADDSTGLMFYGARYYDSAPGRFISPDSVIPDSRNPQAFNRYSYAINNPIKYRDPSGHCFETAWDIGNIIWDLYEVKQDPSIWNIGALVVDVAATVLPVVPAIAGLIVRGGKAAKVGVEAASHVDEATDAARVIARGAVKEGIEQSLSKASLETVQRYGIKPYGEFARPLDEGVDAAHHLVEKRFWRQLGFQSEDEAAQKILAVGVDKATHGPAGKGMSTVTDEIRDRIGYRLSDGANPQEVWEAHRNVYRELGYNDWAELIWDVYFKDLPGLTK